jgi:hypothetical protein
VQASSPSISRVDQTGGQSAFGRSEGVDGIMASLFYGAGLCLLECLRLRAKDIGFSSHQILVREGST